MKISRRALLAASAMAAFFARPADAKMPRITTDIDWPGFLARHDLVWKRLPKIWGEAPFLGNGRLALSVIFAEDGSLRFTVDNTDWYDRRDDSWGWPAYSRSRYLVGAFHLITPDKITGCDLRLSLHDAELSGTLTTETGPLALRAFVAADADIIIIEVSGTHRWEWRPVEAISTRPPVRTEADLAVYRKNYGHEGRIWVDNPPGERQDVDGLNAYLQPLLVGGGTATVWRETNGALVISNAVSFPDTDALETARTAVRQADIGILRERHRAWWHSYYPRSFVTLPDAQLESYYWIQMYKYGCIARPDSGIIDTHGPWLQKSGWPYITWNMNSQVSYYALQPANRLDIGNGLYNALDRNAETLRRNAQTDGDVAIMGHCSQQDMACPLDIDMRYAREWGNLLWVCHNYWLQYRFSMDERMLRDRLFPLLRRAVNFYLPHLSEGADGHLHLPVTYAPEIGESADCNYDLALLKWACSALLTASERLQLNDPLTAKWQDIVIRLVSYPTDENGYRVGADLTSGAHRHFSHLMMIYPLYSVNRDQPETLPLAIKSTEHWLNGAIAEKQAAGFTYAVGASFYAAFGRGDDALTTLKALFVRREGIGRIFPNTMYAESGQNIETPLAAAQSLNDMLIQSWGGVIRVFPAMPTTWTDAAFHDMRAEGAFEVSAVRKEGRTQWLRVKSLAGEPCVIEWPGNAPRVYGAQAIPLGKDRYRLDLKTGQEAIVAIKGMKRFAIVPLATQTGVADSFGLPA